MRALCISFICDGLRWKWCGDSFVFRMSCTVPVFPITPCTSACIGFIETTTFSVFAAIVLEYSNGVKMHIDTIMVISRIFIFMIYCLYCFAKVIL